MKNVMIMFSGGVESTALVQHGLDQQHNLTLVHITHNNKSDKEFTACKGIVQSMCPHTKLYGVEIRKDSYDEQHINAHRDVSIWLGAAMMIVGRGDFDECWYGNHSLDNVQKVPLMESSWDGMIEILKPKKHTKLLSPLKTKTKLDQYNMLTNEVKQRIVSCAVIPKGPWNEPCGECIKCKEFKLYVTDRM